MGDFMNNKGFTVAELLISIMLISVLLLMSNQLLNQNIIKYKQNSNYYKYKLDGRYAMSKVVNEIKKNYGTTFSSNKILSSTSTTLVNSNKNDLTGNIYFYYDANRYGTGDGYGELRRPSGAVLAKNIKEFTIESIHYNLVKVTIQSGKKNTDKNFTISTYVELYD